MSILTAQAAVPRRRRRAGALPGFGPAMGFTLFYLGLIVLFPLAVLAWRATGTGAAGAARIVTDPRILAAFRVSFGTAFAAACIDTVFGVLLAWVLTRYRFPGRRLLDALVDLPFALPTAVAGIALASLYGPNGWLGAPLLRLGVRVAYTPLGILVALIFVGLPFVVRSVQPLVVDLDREVEEASATLGASRARTLRAVVLPTLAPAVLTGFALTFARAVGEYGSVIFIAGNAPYVSEILPLVIVQRLEEYDYAGATGVAVAMLLVSFAVLLAINLVQAFGRRRHGHG
ncbi:sulfate ABC transporter permease subunit CysT [Lichenibacterium minor]|uniref:Sulfate transport system permease protein CysT n=1 Tax=Lichenibacterium minor TaxID=2316528 RepID=A0A4Q2UCE1_9HYPH|nr:sulfate ABC transporter permease subunit CysT [Lichenibacterium minor]RYC32837.1 sulfate ABC transporter permease subunit CysT [Lichenibacterium minor]